MEDRRFRFGGTVLPLGRRTYIMGILNVTPDSFSDGGAWLDPAAAVAHARAMVAEGAVLIDVGGESTRPGHVPVPLEEEWRRVAPVLERLLDEPALAGVGISLDTRKPEVARRALRLGVPIINDVEGFRDPAMVEAVADSSAGLVMMFNRPRPYPPGAVDPAGMRQTLEERTRTMERAGIAAERILWDPGLGFAYAVEDNWTVLRSLTVFGGGPAGLLLGPSRKRFLGALLDRPRPPERDVATAAVAALAVAAGVDVVRVHNVAVTRDAVAVADAWYRGRQPQEAGGGT
ncbi:MAG: dihydropteroate synthase [Firmicutes bacterium]|nr:dihydropteroate synthase [Bacillota bacterium]